MRSIGDRYQTFIESENWPRERIAADPKLIADAWFYYLGDGDRAKCWYCNGGLKNWERFDDPWIEHAKRYPFCEYLLKNRRVDFVKDIVRGFVTLNRPPVPNPPPKSKLQGLEKLVNHPSLRKHQPSFPPLIDPRGGVDVKEKVEREMLLGRNVEMVKLLGFEDRKISRVLTKRFQEHNENFATFYDFTLKLMEEPDVIFKPKLTMKRAKEILDEVKCLKCEKKERCMVPYISHVLTLLIVFHAPGSRDCVPFVVNLVKKKSVRIECKTMDCAIFTKLAYSPIMCDRGAIAPKTAEDFFPFCGAITFFSSSIKRAALKKLEIMQSYTNRADELYLEAENVQIPDFIPPFTSCYETLYKQEELIERARTMEDSVRQIRHQFLTIADSGFPLPNSTLLRKAVVSVKKGKFIFSTEQLSRVVQMIMENKPYLLFRPKSDTKDYVILVFWSTNFDDKLCSIQENAEVIKKEVLADGYQLRFKVENIPLPRRFTLYMLNNYITLSPIHTGVAIASDDAFSTILTRKRDEQFTLNDLSL